MRSFIFIILYSLISYTIYGQVSPPITNNSYQSINSVEEMIWYQNAQNLVSTWNNIIIHSKTGEEQLKVMRESGIFDEDVKLNFDFGEQKLSFNNLEEEPLAFYNSFVNPLKKNRYNICSNVQVVEFGDDFLRFNFKHWIFFNEKLSVVGENQCIMRKNNSGYYISEAYIKVIHYDAAHAY